MHPKLLNSGLCIYKILQIIVNNKNRMSNYANVSSFKFQVLFVTYTTIQRLYNQQWNESRVRSMDSANIEKTTQGK